VTPDQTGEHESAQAAGSGAGTPSPGSSAFIQTAGARIGSYTLISKLGQGGMGAVYKARQEGMDRLVAIKVLPKSLARDEAFIARFLREARSAGRLSHPNIVAGIDAGFADGYYYFAMEYIEGTSLGERLAAEGRIPEAEVIEYGRQVALALAHAHRAGIVHRDAKLCDLGLAMAAGEDLRITQAGIAIGTPYYISPEQAAGGAADARSDIYSLGCTLFHLVAGRPPFDGTNALEIMYKHLNSDAPPLRSLCPGAGRVLESVLARMMARSPAARHQTAEEVAEDLARAALGTATRPLPTSLPRARPARPGSKSGPALTVPARKRRWAGLVWAAAAGLIAVALAIFVAARGKDGRKHGPGTEPVPPVPPARAIPPTPSDGDGPLRAEWKQVATTGEAPGARNHITTAMTYDSKRRRSVLFGGTGNIADTGYGYANDLWALDLAAKGWTRLEPNRPKDPGIGTTLPAPESEGRHLIYDQVRDVYLWNAIWAYDPNARAWKPEPKIDDYLPYGWNFLAGCAYNPDARSFLWWKETTVLIDARTNRVLNAKPGPKYLDYATGDLAYDRKNKLFVLFHPGGRSTKTSEPTWIFDPAAGAWRPAKPAVSPPHRWAHNLVPYDRLGLVVLVGGCTDYYKDWRSDLWAYDAAKDVWTELKPAPPIPPAAECAAVYDASLNLIAAFVNNQVWTLKLERAAK
jgi:hypothetical protein